MGRAYNSFGDLVNEVNTTLQSLSLSVDTSMLNQMHKARNNVQHNGILLSTEQVSGYFASIQKLFFELSDRCFGIKWNDVSLALLIQDNEASADYREVERLINEKNFKQATKRLILLFERSIQLRQADQYGSNITQARSSAEKSSKKDQRALYDYTYKIEQELEVKKLDLDYKRWRDYRFILNNLDPFAAFVKISSSEFQNLKMNF